MTQTTFDLALHESGTRLANLEHLKRIADAMYPDPREWAYTGQVIDAGAPCEKCACGHPIRYIFVIERKRDGKALPIGSTCITSTVPHLLANGAVNLATALRQALSDHEQALADIAKSERAAQQHADCEAARLEYEQVNQRALAIRRGFVERGAWIPHAIYGCRLCRVCPTYKLVSSRIKWYRQAAEAIRAAYREAGYDSL